MATHSSVLAWRIPGTGEPGGLPSMACRLWGQSRTRLKRRSSSSNCKYFFNSCGCFFFFFWLKHWKRPWKDPILWLLDAKSWLIGKDPDAGKDWRQEEKQGTEDEMVGWYHWLDGHEFEQSLGVGDGQGSLACCSPWGYKELDMTVQLNWTFNSHSSGGWEDQDQGADKLGVWWGWLHLKKINKAL